MPQPPHDPILAAYAAVLFSAALLTSIGVLARRFRRGAFLSYEPRTPVPWGIWAAGLAVLQVIAKFAPGAGQPSGAEAALASSEANLALRLIAGLSLQCLLMGLFLFAVVVISGATRDDLGLPPTARQARRDVSLGVLVCLAAYLPVTAVFNLVGHLLGQPELHPLVEQVRRQPDPAVFAIAFLSVVVVAPIVEELMFRLLLQGWLEKWEDATLGWRSGPSTSDPTAAIAVGDAAPSLAPPAAGVGFMPHGSLPIFVSSTFFAWAHVGHSTDPFPLFVLAMFLGYTYQRTHRILPCIVAHAVFNLISVPVLYRMLFVAGNG